MNLRDHDQPTITDLRLIVLCKHGEAKAHMYYAWPTTSVLNCPGGRAPTRQELIDMLRIDYEAAADYLRDSYQRIRDHIGDELAEKSRWIVGAALGFTDD